MTAEVWDAYTADGQLIPDKKLCRDQFPTSDGDYHLAVNVWVVDKGNRLLFTRRAQIKSHFPGIYEAGAGGSVLAGEESLDAALRELVEETGLIPQKIERLFSFTEDQHFTHFDVFLAQVDQHQPEIFYQKGETDGHKWVYRAELASFLDSKPVFSNQRQQLMDYFHRND